MIDLTVPATIAAAVHEFAPTIVINAAAYTSVDRAESEPELAFTINAEGPARMAEICARRDIPLIHISTDYVFDGTKSAPYVEDDPVAPLGTYGLSKLKGEERIAAICHRHVILRTAWLFSPYGNNFVKTMLRLATKQAEVAVVADQVGTPTYASHLAIALLMIAQRCVFDRMKAVPWGIYHAAGAGAASWYDLALGVFQQSARIKGPNARVIPICTSQYPLPARRPANSRLDSSKLARAFGVRLPDWRIGIAECVPLLSQHTGNHRT